MTPNPNNGKPPWRMEITDRVLGYKPPEIGRFCENHVDRLIQPQALVKIYNPQE